MQLLFDIGGSVTKLAVSYDGKNIGEPRRIPSAKDFDVGIRTLAEAARDLAFKERITVAAGGIAGSLDTDKSTLVTSPNLSGWTGKPLKEELERVFGAPVILENDAALAGLGEAHAGAGRGASIVAYITVSTGVGGVRIVDGAIDRNRLGFEPGHQVIDIGGTACGTCNALGMHADGPGHLEGYISGAAVERRFGVPPQKIINPALWDELARFLAYGLNNTILHWSPDVVVLGGSMIVRPMGIKVARVQEHLKNILSIIPASAHPELRQATLDDFGGLHGALALIRTRGRM